MSCCGVDETSGSTASKTSYQVPGILQETGWDVFTIRAEKGSIVKGICFCIYVRRFFLFFFVAVVLCASISYVVSCVGVWWRHDMYIFNIYFVCTTTVPDTKLLAYVCCARRIQQCMCSTLNRFFPVKFRRVVRTNEQNGRSSAQDVQVGWQLNH